jgi:hypothetical protein
VLPTEVSFNVANINSIPVFLSVAIIFFTSCILVYESNDYILKFSLEGTESLTMAGTEYNPRGQESFGQSRSKRKDQWRLLLRNGEYSNQIL